MTRGQQVLSMEPCKCSVCDIGRLNGQSYITYKETVTEPVGRPSTRGAEPEPEPVLLCNVCLSSWGPGQNHVCTKSTKKTNIEELVRSNSSNSKEQIISSQLKEVFEEKRLSSVGGSVLLKTNGKPLTTTIGDPKKKPMPKFSNDSLNRLQIQMGASDNKMNSLGNFLRMNCGRSSVVKLQEHMISRNKKLTSHFSVKSVVLAEYVTKSDKEDKENTKKKETHHIATPVVFAKDVEELTLFVMKERGLIPDTSVVQVGVDDGQGL